MISKKLLYVTLFSLSWSSAIFFQKLALNAGAAPMVLTVHVALVSAILLSLYVLTTRFDELKKIKRRDLKTLVPIGLFVGAAYTSEKFGLALSTSINFAFLIKSTLVFVILMASIFLNESLTAKKLTLLITFMTGAYLISTGGTTLIPQFGDLLILLAAFFFSAALIIQKQIATSMSAELIGWARLFFAQLPLVILIAILKSDVLTITTPLYVFLAGASVTSLAIYISKTLEYSSASYLTMMSMMVPVISSVLGVSLLGEAINTIQILGGTLIIISGMLVHKWNI